MHFWLSVCWLFFLLSSCSEQSAQQLSTNTFSAEIKQLFLVSSVSPLHTKPGTEVTISGAGFTDDLILRIDSDVLSPTKPPTSDSVSFILPERSAGIVGLVIRQGEEEVRVPFVIEPSGDTPLFLGSSAIFCKGSNFLNASGTMGEGSRDCRTSIIDSNSGENPVYNCSKEGEVGCIATDLFPSVEKSTLSDKVLKGFSIAGVAGTISDAVCPIVSTSVAINDKDFKLLVNRDNESGVEVGGSCSHLKSSIEVSIGDSLVGSTECFKDGVDYKWKLNFNASSFIDGDLALKAKIVLAGANSAEVQKVLLKDTQPPGNVTLTNTPSSSSALTEIKSIVKSTDLHSFQYTLIETDSTCTGASYGSWQDASVEMTVSLGADGDKTLCIIGQDLNGNSQAIPTRVFWQKDTQPLANVTMSPVMKSQSNVSNLNTDVLATDLDSFKFDVLSGAVDCSGASYGTWKQSTEKLQEALGPDGEYTLCIIGRDRALNEQITPTRYTWNKDTQSPGKVTANPPTGRSNLSNVKIAVTGTDVVMYKYSLSTPVVKSGSSCSTASYSGWIAIEFPIIQSNLSSEDTFNLCIIGKDAAANEQLTPTHYSWVRDTLPPANAALDSLPSNPSAIQTLNVKVTGEDIDSYKYSIGTDSDCSNRSYGEWVAVSKVIDDNLGSDGTYVLCVIARDIAENAQEVATSYTWVKRTKFLVKVKADNIYHSKVVLALLVGTDLYNFELDKSVSIFQTPKEFAEGTTTSLTISQSLQNPAIPCTTTQATDSVGTADLTLVVTCPAIETISIFAGSTSVASGSNRQIYATGGFSGGFFADITDIANWTTSAPEKATVTKGLVYGVQDGSVNINAALGSRNESLSMQVIVKSIQTLIVSPSTLSHPISSTKAFRAVATWSDGEVQDVTTSCSWTSSVTSVASFNNVNVKGLVTTKVAGNTSITATIGVKSAAASLTVTNATLNSIEVSPAILTGASGIKKQFTATGIYSNGTTQDLTSQVNWTIPATGVASVTNLGLVELVNVGSTTITATLGALTASRGIIVNAATLDSISISPTSSISIAAGYSRQLSVTAHYSDSTSIDVTQQVQWSVSNSSYAVVGNNAGSHGLLQALSSGSLSVTASLGNKTSSLAVNVSSATLTSIAVSPKTFLVSRNGTLQYSAVGTFSDGSTANITDQVLWSKSYSSTVISNTPGSKGFFSNTYTGTDYPAFTVTAAMSNVSGTATGVLTAGTLTGLKMNPFTAKVSVSQSIPFKVYGIYSDGASFDVTNHVVFSTSKPNIGLASNASIQKGLFTGVEEGETEVRASFSGLNVFSNVEVKNGIDFSLVNQGVGLTAKYYTFDWISPGGDFITQLSNINETKLKGTRIDNSVFFDWGEGVSPLGITNDFAVRWTGKVYFPEGGINYQIRTKSDDGVRLWIDNVLVINEWSDHPPTAHFTNSFSAIAGYKDVKLEFYEHGEDAVMKLEWKYGGMPDFAPIPTTYLFPE